MSVTDVALVSRAKGIGTHLIPRERLDRLADAVDTSALVRALANLGPALEPVGEPRDVRAIERAAARTAHRYLLTLYRWQERTPGVLDLFVAYQDRRSLRALLRGAIQGAPPEARLDGLLPTPWLPQRLLEDLARQASAKGVARHLLIAAHPDAPRLLPLVQRPHVDLLDLEIALLHGMAERVSRAAAAGDRPLRDFAAALIDAGNVHNALLTAGDPSDAGRRDLFVGGGRWLSSQAFAATASAPSRAQALELLASSLAATPLAPALPAIGSDVAGLDRAFLAAALRRVTRLARLEPLSTAPLIRVLLLVDAQTRDLRALAWGARLGTPPATRRQQLVTPP